MYACKSMAAQHGLELKGCHAPAGHVWESSGRRVVPAARVPCPPLTSFTQALAALATPHQRRGGLVKDEDPGPRQQRACNGQPLPLPAAELHAAARANHSLRGPHSSMRLPFIH